MYSMLINIHRNSSICYCYKDWCLTAFEHIDKERDARERISTDLRFIMDYIYKYCDNID